MQTVSTGKIRTRKTDTKRIKKNPLKIPPPPPHLTVPNALISTAMLYKVSFKTISPIHGLLPHQSPCSQFSKTLSFIKPACLLWKGDLKQRLCELRNFRIKLIAFLIFIYEIQINISRDQNLSLSQTSMFEQITPQIYSYKQNYASVLLSLDLMRFY